MVDEFVTIAELRWKGLPVRKGSALECAQCSTNLRPQRTLYTTFEPPLTDVFLYQILGYEFVGWDRTLGDLIWKQWSTNSQPSHVIFERRSCFLGHLRRDCRYKIQDCKSLSGWATSRGRPGGYKYFQSEDLPVKQHSRDKNCTSQHNLPVRRRT